MREIKFKRYYQHDETGRFTFQLWGKLDLRDNSVNDFGSFKSPTYMHRWFPIADCQYTGLKDREGKEIYEGDIIESTHTHNTYLAVWNDRDCYMAREIYDFRLKRNTLQEEKNGSLHFMTTFDIKIIGNIYENPELLTK